MEEFKDILARLTIPAIIAAAGALTRILFDSDKLTWTRVLRGLFIGLTVGSIVGMILEPLAMPLAHKGAIIGVASIISEDVIATIVHAGGKLREDPEKYLLDFLKRRK